nr:hypothetical protein [Massilia sp. CCM 8734]
MTRFWHSKPTIVLHAQRHPAVHAGLEFEQDVHVQELLSDPHAPDYIVLAPRQTLAHIHRIDRFEGGQRDIVKQLERREVRDQLAHQFRMGEQRTVSEGVMSGHEAF